MAQRYWPDEDPIGHRVHFGGPQAKNPWITIVGIVSDVRSERLEDAPRPMLYRPLSQASGLALAVVLRGSSDSKLLGKAFAREVRAADSDLPTYGVRSLRTLVDSAMAARRFTTQVLGAFAVLALVLAAVGIYGVMAFIVGQRTREIGIRIALGARPTSVVGLVLKQALVLAAFGVVIGGAAALVLSQFMTRMLFEVRPKDPLTYGIIGMLLGLTAALAAWFPARKASAVDPLIALRAE
jgi:ABC-type antimicrobial peptide transport system permease subunit